MELGLHDDDDDDEDDGGMPLDEEDEKLLEVLKAAVVTRTGCVIKAPPRLGEPV